MTPIKSLSSLFRTLLPVRLSQTGFFLQFSFVKTFIAKTIIYVVCNKKFRQRYIVYIIVFYFNESFRLNQSRLCANQNFNVI
jgi:hypothetical protein